MPPNRKSIQPMVAPESGVTVRMYKTGFGDCFLLTFRGEDDKPVHMLIDCGAHSQWSGGGKRIVEIAEHIRASTDEHLAVVAITHEHADHISGFGAARNVFEGMKDVAEAWFGWTEKPGDPEVDALKRQRSLMMAGLRAARQSFANTDETAAGNLAGMLGFFEVAGANDTPLPITGAQAMDVVRKKARKQQYLKPKCPPLTVPGVEGVRVFVLGPPVDRKYLMAAGPSSAPREVYTELALATAMMAAAGDQTAGAEEFQPFAGNFRVLTEVAREHKDHFKFFHEYYGFDENDPGAWRRIDLDWQYAAESLALKLDAATNNTSLVLAIELMNTGRVLLFPGDAQVGNWESWHDGDWTEENGLAKGEKITARDLLSRTVLYKVGHHGSHNATLREKGLEMMTSPELVAMIPVDEKWALARKPKPWKMPFEPLYSDLKVRTKGRILRIDSGLVDPPRSSAWGSLQPRDEDLYVEVTIEDPGTVGRGSNKRRREKRSAAASRRRQRG